MNKFCKRISIYAMSAMLAFSSTPVGTVQAHSGRTDASGGHHDNKNASGLGSYHYHCGGYPAHLHEGGVCPYSSSAVAETTVSEVISETAAAVSTTSGSQSTAKTTASNTVKLSTGSSISISKDLIKIVQDVLNQKGYDCGSVDGVAGSKTKAAIKKYLEEADSSSTDHVIVDMVAEGLGIE